MNGFVKSWHDLSNDLQFWGRRHNSCHILLPRILFSTFGKRQNKLGKRTLSPTANSIFPSLNNQLSKTAMEKKQANLFHDFQAKKKEKWIEQNYQM